MSTKPGVTIRPSASISRRPVPSSRPTAAILPSCTATSAMRRGRARAVDHGSVSDDEVKHGVEDRPGRGPGGLCCASPISHPVPGDRPLQKPLLFSAAQAARRHRAQPLRRLAHGAVPRHRRAGERLPPGPSRQVRARQVRHRLHRELRRRAARPRHPGRSRHVGRRPDRGAQAAGAVPQAGGRARRPRRSRMPAARASTPRSFDKPGQLGPAGAGWQKWQVVGPSEIAGRRRAGSVPRQLAGRRDRRDGRGGSARRRAAPTPRATT